MPTLEKTDGSLPRSALRYRPTEASTITVDEYTAAANTPVLQVRRASRVRQPQAVDDDAKQDNSDPAETGRGSATAHKARRAPTLPTTPTHLLRPKKATQPRARLHPLFFLLGDVPVDTIQHLDRLYLDRRYSLVGSSSGLQETGE